MKVGIFFGGTGAARETSFASGRTVYDNLDKSLFEAVPIFVDSLGNFILLDWPHLYKPGIRSFYPPTEVVPESEYQLPVYIESLGNLSAAHQTEIINRVGQQLFPADFKNFFDFAFLVLPDNAAGKGSIQRILADNYIPHSGPGESAAISTDRIHLKQELKKLGFPVVPFRVVTAETWAAEDQREALFKQLQRELGLPLVISPAGQPASFGNAEIAENDFTRFAAALERSLGQKTVYRENWLALSRQERLGQVIQITDIQTSIGLPVRTRNGTVLHHPEQLLKVLNRLFTETDLKKLTLYATDQEEPLALVQCAPTGIDFSCLVMWEEQGKPLALVPEVIEREENNKVLTSENNTARTQLTPVQIAQIRQECQRWSMALDVNAYACLKGFVENGGNIYLEEVQTTPEMLPTSLVFRQAAAIGLNPTQFLTFVIRHSLAWHLKTSPDALPVQIPIQDLDEVIQESHQLRQRKVKVGILMSGESADADNYIASGRYIYQLLAASEKYQPIPIFRSGPAGQPRYYILPLTILWRANAEAIREKILQVPEGQPEEELENVRAAADHLITTFGGPLLREPQFIFFDHLNNLVDVLFISLPEQEAATGTLQAELEKLKLAYTGSDLSGLQLGKNKARQQALWQEQKHTETEGMAEQADKPLAAAGDLEPWREITSNVLTRHLPDGRLEYEVFQTVASAPTETVAFPDSKAESFILPDYDPDPNTNQLVIKKVELAVKKAAQVLNIQNYAQLKVLVRIKADQDVQTVLQEVRLFPALTPVAGIFQGAAGQGYTPYDFVDQVLQFALERQKKKVHGHRHTQF